MLEISIISAHRLRAAVGVLSILFALALCAGCDGPNGADSKLVLATTTSTRDSGLLDELLPRFEQRTGLDVQVIAVGTGQALELGRRGDADVLLTHAKPAEQQFVQDAYGVRRIPVMANDFVLVGPSSDRAALRGTTDIVAAFQKIAELKHPFVSRGDQSGTHMKELQIWQSAKIEPAGDDYLESGSGMAATLRVASEKGAITLTDRGTFLAQQDHLSLEILVQRDPLLRNEYAVIVVSPEKHPHINVAAAEEFADFLTSAETQRLIGQFGVSQYGMPLFYPHSSE